MQWQNPLKFGSLIWSRNSLHIHLFSSDRSRRQGQNPPVRFSPSRTVFTISASSFSRTAIGTHPFRENILMLAIKMAERVGFEPTVRCRITGFQDRLLKPLGHLSVQAKYSISKLKSQGLNFWRRGVVCDYRSGIPAFSQVSMVETSHTLD